MDTARRARTRAAAGRRWSRDDFEFGRPLGRGGFGHYYLMREKATQFIVTLKVVKKEYLDTNGYRINLVREIELQNLVQDHPNVLRLYEYFHDETSVIMIQEYFIGGSLCKVLSEAGHLEEARAMRILLQLADVLEYCHSKRVIHRDINTDNVLFRSNDTVKLASFGFSILKKVPGPYFHTMCGKESYRAPEVVLNIPCDEKIDVWSLGVVFYEMSVGHLPFNGNAQARDERIINVDYSCTHTYVQDDAKDLIAKFLVRIPHERIGLDQVANHEWIERVSRELALRENNENDDQVVADDGAVALAVDEVQDI